MVPTARDLSQEIRAQAIRFGVGMIIVGVARASAEPLQLHRASADGARRWRSRNSERTGSCTGASNQRGRSGSLSGCRTTVILGAATSAGGSRRAWVSVCLRHPVARPAEAQSFAARFVCMFVEGARWRCVGCVILQHQLAGIVQIRAPRVRSISSCSANPVPKIALSN